MQLLDVTIPFNHMRSLTTLRDQFTYKPLLHKTYSHVTLSLAHSTAYIQYKDRALLCGAYTDTLTHTNTPQPVYICCTRSTWMSPQLLHPSPITGHKVQGTGGFVCYNGRPIQVAGDSPGTLYLPG